MRRDGGDEDDDDDDDYDNNGVCASVPTEIEELFLHADEIAGGMDVARGSLGRVAMFSYTKHIVFFIV